MVVKYNNLPGLIRLLLSYDSVQESKSPMGMIRCEYEDSKALKHPSKF